MTRYAGVTPLHYVGNFRPQKLPPSPRPLGKNLDPYLLTTRVALHFNMSENQKTKYRLNNICLMGRMQFTISFYMQITILQLENQELISR